MKIKILFFGELKEFFGKAEDILQVKEGACVRDIFSCFLDQKNDDVWYHHLLCAVNHEQVSDDHWLKEGDEVALMPPMTGG